MRRIFVLKKNAPRAREENLDKEEEVYLLSLLSPKGT
jgi:hypothetical protein